MANPVVRFFIYGIIWFVIFSLPTSDNDNLYTTFSKASFRSQWMKSMVAWIRESEHQPSKPGDEDKESEIQPEAVIKALSDPFQKK